MQIIIDTKDNPAHVAGAIALLQELFAIGDDAPDRGQIVDPASIPKPPFVPPPPPAVVSDIPPLPNVDAAAAAFGVAGGAAVPIPPAPLTAPAASAPVAGPASAPAPTVAAPQAGGSVQLDKEGLPWNAQIHSTPAKINTSDGLWRAKRGLNDPAFVNRIKAELRAVQAIPFQGGVPPVPPATVQPPPAVAPGAVAIPGFPPGTPSAADMTLVPQPPALAAPPAPPAPPVTMTFQAFVQEITPYLQNGRLTHAELNTALASNNLPSLGMLATRPDLVMPIRAHVLALVKPAA